MSTEPDAAVVDASDAGASPVVEVGPPCPSGGKALSFEGTSRVDIPGTNVPIGNSARTVEMWVSPATTTAAGVEPESHRLRARLRRSQSVRPGHGRDSDDGALRQPRREQLLFQHAGFAQATWFHVATTYDGATTVHAYINGADKGTKTLTGPLASTLNTLTVGGTNSSRYFIGASTRSGYGTSRARPHKFSRTCRSASMATKRDWLGTGTSTMARERPPATLRRRASRARWSARRRGRVGRHPDLEVDLGRFFHSPR